MGFVDGRQQGEEEKPVKRIQKKKKKMKKS